MSGQAAASEFRQARQVACFHCGLPVPVRSRPDGGVFCCIGCEVAHAALQSTGLSDTYYRLRDTVPPYRSGRPAYAGAPDLGVAGFDSDAFVETCPAGPDGSRRADLVVDGVYCAACVWLLERLPAEIAGVEDARLDLARGRLRLLWQPSQVRLSDVVEWITRFGYRVHPAASDEAVAAGISEKALLRKMGACWALAGNVMLLAFALYAGLDDAGDAGLATGARLLSLGLALVAVLYGGSEFFRRAWQSVRLSIRQRDVRLLHMDTPISGGILVGFGNSVWATVTGSGQIWFDSVTVLIAALLTARWLQVRSRRMAGEATLQLTSMVPARVRRMGADGVVQIVDASEVRTGHLVEVLAGDVIPVDGVVVRGHSRVNNAVMSGESRHVDVGLDSEVVAGATNVYSPLVVRATAAGSSTRLGRLLEWASDPSPDRAPVIELANRLTGYFVAGVLLLAVATFWTWMRVDPSVAIGHVVAVLVITCPCALGMATPLAMAVGAGRAARQGIFIRDGGTLQRLSRIASVIVDKTGTLTQGELSIVTVAGDRSALMAAASLESHVSHPIARALSSGIPRVASVVTDIESVPGGGVRGIVSGETVAAGSLRWLAEQEVLVPDDLDRAWREVDRRGLTPVAVSVGGRVRAVAGLGDAVRPDAAQMVLDLQSRGIRVLLASGDEAGVVSSVADQIGIDAHDARSGVSPEGKVQWLDQLRRNGWGDIAFLGDGVNDAAAIGAADVGIAVDGGSAASQVVADVFLRRPGIGPVVSLVDGARHIMNVVKFNLGLSLLYNVLGGIAALAGMVTPLAAAVAMPLSSLLVVAISVTQRSFESEGGLSSERSTDRKGLRRRLVLAGGN